MRATFVSRGWDNEAGTIGSFYFKPLGQYRFTAGQYADITVPHENPDSRGQTRTMTFSSSPEEKLLRITTRLGPDKSTYKQALLGLKPGDEVNLTDGMGDMVLPLDPAVPLVFVAGGVGIASYTGMLQWLLEHRDARDITLLYSVRDAGDIVFSKLINRYGGFHPLTSIIYAPAIESAPRTWKGKVISRRLTAAGVMEFVKPEAQIYLSGTEQMVEQLRHGLLDNHKIPQYRIAFDYFSGYTSEI